MISCFFQDAEVMFCGSVPHPLLASIVMSLKEKTQSGRYFHEGRPKTSTQTIICIMSSGVNTESFSEQSKR